MKEEMQFLPEIFLPVQELELEMSKVAIFGSGLSAAYVYAACLDNEIEVDFFTDKPFSARPEFFGPVKLSWVPESLQFKLMPCPVWLFSLGSKKDYLQRMGRKTGSTTFPENGRVQTFGYNPAEMLEHFYPPYSKVTLGKFSDNEIESISKNYDYTFVTFPLQQSKGEDKLVFYWIYLLKNQTASIPNMVIYNAAPTFFWTRFSHYWGTYMWEYSHVEFPNIPPCPDLRAEARKINDIAPGVAEYISPFPKVELVGRWARWSKDVLAQDAYTQADKILKEL
jgi:hypothetical protein